MSNRDPVQKSRARLAFEIYLRIGLQNLKPPLNETLEIKFNPYHDPRDGRFTFAPGGPRSLHPILISDRRGVHQIRESRPLDSLESPSITASSLSDGSQKDPNHSETSISLKPVSHRPNPRLRIGDNGGPPLNDPMTLERVFPNLNNSPTSSLVSIADNILDITGPSQRLTTQLANEHINLLLSQIRSANPKYRFDSLGFPTTLEGQANLIRQLSMDRATALYRRTGNAQLLQIETVKLIQRSADQAYTEGQALFDAGRLLPRLSREQAIGNYVDRSVRRTLRQQFDSRGIDYSKGKTIRVIGREYDTSGTEMTYRIPDARIGNIAFDVTLTRKTLATPQVRGFFKSDFKPDIVIIIRPTQLGMASSYAIKRPEK